jgi:hypothetical protein
MDWPADDIASTEWDGLPPVSLVKTGSLDPAAWDKIRDMYVVPDEQTLRHNASLRTAAPTPAAKTWRGKVSRMVNNQRTTQDAMLYRTAAFTPDFAQQLVPGAVIADPGFTSTESTPGFTYADVRADQVAGSQSYFFHIQVPAGTPAADVGYGEVVLDYGNSMEILSVGMIDGRRTVVVRLIPKGAAKEK